MAYAIKNTINAILALGTASATVSNLERQGGGG
jgi:hypothetical protein